VDRNHVGRQRFGQCPAQVGDARGQFAVGDKIGDQALNVVIVAQQDRRGADTRLPAEGGFDLAEFDAKAAYLDLVVGAPKALHATVGIDAGEVAGAVQASIARVVRPRVGEEFFGAQVRPAEIAGGNPGAADAQFAGFALWQQAQAVRYSRASRGSFAHGLARNFSALRFGRPR